MWNIKKRKMEVNNIKNRIGNQLIIKSYEAGFRATSEGNIISHKGKRVGSDRGDGRISFASIKDDNGIRRMLLAHRFIAYQLYGDKIFEKGIIVRHLNDNPSDNRFENIAIGTRKDNARDGKRNGVVYGGWQLKKEYGNIYRYYKKYGWNKTLRRFDCGYSALSYIKNNYKPTLKDKILMNLNIT